MLVPKTGGMITDHALRLQEKRVPGVATLSEAWVTSGWCMVYCLGRFEEVLSAACLWCFEEILAW